MGLEVIAGAALFGSAASFYGQKRAGDRAENAAEAMGLTNQQAADLQRKRAGIEARRTEILNARDLRNSIRQARIARAAVINTGAVSGTMDSSGVLGGAGSITSQEAGNIGFAGQIADINEQSTAINKALGDVAAEQGRIQGDLAVAEAAGRQWGAFGNLAGTIFNIRTDNWQTIFAKKRGGAGSEIDT